MFKLHFVLFIFVLGVAWFSPKKVSAANPELCTKILTQLSEKENEDLGNYIIYLGVRQDKSSLSDDEINLILKKLREIQTSDPYKKEMIGKGGKVSSPPHYYYDNRGIAESCIFNVGFQKTANRLRKLPMEKRVEEIFKRMGHPSKLRYESTGLLSDELKLAGTNAVPYIIRHKPADASFRCQIMLVLKDIGDPRAIPYLVEVLQTEGSQYKFIRRNAVQYLSEFKGETVLLALVDALKDSTFRVIDKNLGQQLFPKNHKAYLGRFYMVRYEAARSLSKRTGENWGYLYNEDYQTWAAWFSSKNRATFNPQLIPRSEAEKRQLIYFLFCRYMSNHDLIWRPDQPQAIALLAKDLEILGESVVQMLIDECQKQIEATPIWVDKLSVWTQKILQSLPWSDAQKAAQKMDR